MADFHAAGRHTYITQLLRHGASLPEAKELARHTDVKMTMRYAHIGLEDQARALASLPAPPVALAPEPSSFHSTPQSAMVPPGHRANDSNGQNGPSPVTARPRSAAGRKRQYPRRGRGFGNESQTESSAVADDPKWRWRESNAADEYSISLDDNDLRTEPTAVVAPGHRARDIMGQSLSSKGISNSPDDLQFVVDAWPNVSLEVREAIYSIVRAIVER